MLFSEIYIFQIDNFQIFKIISFAFDKYPQLRSEAFILGKLFSIISRSVKDKYPNWFIQGECATYCKNLIYFTLTVKVYKDSDSKNS